MSSNTLRGIGQEGGGEDGGDGEDRDSGDRRDVGDLGDVGPFADGAGRDQDQRDAKKLFDGLQQLRNVRSLDSTVPGTRSLDSSVPNAEPSLDGKVPSLAATMMGVSAPAVSGREQGTVQGRDVHLPVEIQRMAGMRPVARTHETEPDPVELSAPTQAVPVEAAALPESAGEFIHGQVKGQPRTHQPDLNSHSPWYDQEPNSEGVYDDPKPNVLGRVAIGVAVVAAISVVLFAAAIRLRAQNAAEAQAEATVVAPPTLIVSTPIPEPMPEPVAPAPTVAPAPGALPVSPDPAVGLKSTPTAADASPAWRPTRTASAPQGRPQAVAASSARVGVARTGRGAVTAASATAGAATTSAAATGTAAPRGAPTTDTAPPTVSASSPSSPPAAAELDPPATAPSSPPKAPDRARGKPYDPDSTLPLNIE